ncbi:MAG: hypothetical protein H7Y42_00825 [Chitinophagaceae bacterium]|nr:hypothetical protein [Chitinophagaceae bacterium]
METTKKSSHSTKSNPGARPVLTQAENNTTLWVGHLKTDPTDHFAGQTFTCPSDGQLDNIQLYSTAVQCAGEIVLTLHEFDARNKAWEAAIGNATVVINKEDQAKWIRFTLPAVQLREGTTYGFRVHTKEAMVGLGEAAKGTKQPFTFGHEWSGDSRNERGHYYTYFSLAFKVELRA